MFRRGREEVHLVIVEGGLAGVEELEAIEDAFAVRVQRTAGDAEVQRTALLAQVLHSRSVDLRELEWVLAR